MKNLSNTLINPDKSVTTKNVLKSTGIATLIQIMKEGVLSDHQSKADALLVLLKGAVVYEENDRNVELSNIHDSIDIPAKVTHRVRGLEDSLLLLVQ